MGLSKDLGFEVIAEGAETIEQIKSLTKLGCFVAQGYYYYHPLPFKKFASLL